MNIQHARPSRDTQAHEYSTINIVITADTQAHEY